MDCCSHVVHAHADAGRASYFEPVLIRATNTDMVIALRLVGHADGRDEVIEGYDA